MGGYAQTFKKVTDASEIVAGGEYLIVYESANKAYGGVSSNIGVAVDVSILSNSISNVASAHVVKLGGNDGKWTIFDETDNVYLAFTGTKNKLNAVTEETTKGTTWVITTSNIKNVDYSTYTLKYNTSSPRFACYASGQKDVVLFKKDASSTKTATTVSFGSDNDNKTFSVNVGDAFTAPTATLTPAEAGTIAYSSDKPEVAAVDATTGAVTLGETEGSATITASFEGNDTYAASSASYTIKLTKPFTVEDGVFNFAHPEAYGKGTSSVSSHDGDFDEGESIKAGNVTLKVTKNNTKTPTRFWSDGLRIYDDAQFTISVPDGYVITAVVANPSGQVTIGTLNSQSTTLDFNKTTLKSITVTYEKATVSDVALHIGSTGYATLYYSDRALTVPENAEATTYSAEFGKGLEVSTRYEEGQVIPAGEAVVVYALEPGDYVFKVADGSNVKLDDTNMLFGTDEEKAIENDDAYYFYKLSLDSNGNNVGFYWGAEDGAAFTIGAHKAYLKVTKENAANAKAFVFGGDVTGMKAITTVKTDTNAPLYNLAGQRVGKSYKGIVIQNGKKYVK